jgi:hypothetical protein
MNRVGGIIAFQVNGQGYRAKGSFGYNIGSPMREAVVGTDTVHGFKETPQVSFIEGEITDDGTIDLRDLTTIRNATVTLDLPNGKMVALYDAYFAGEGSGNTEEGNIPVRFESGEGEEVPV